MIKFLVDSIHLDEGETVEAVVDIVPGALRGETAIRYRLTPDTADAADYVAGSGRVIVFTNHTRATIRIPIVDDNIIERARDTFSLSLVASERYELDSPNRITVTIKEGICDRTSSVRDSLINTPGVLPSSGVTDCSEIHTVRQLTNTKISGADVSAYKKDDFTDTSLRPANISILELSRHSMLTTLPVGLFTHTLLDLNLYDNDVLAALPEELFVGLVNLQRLRLDGNALITLPEELFADLVDLQQLRLNGNDLTALPEELFANLVDLRRLRLDGNDLTALPPGTFSGLSNLRSLQLHDNPGAPFRLALGVEPADETEELANLLSANTPAMVKLTLREGAPYPLTLALTASDIQLSTNSVTIPAGGTQSETFAVTRIAGEDRAMIALSEPPSRPNDCDNNWKHEGQCFTGFEIAGAPIIDIVYDGVAPQVTTIRFTSTPQGPYGYLEGGVIRVDVVFDRGLILPPIAEGPFSPTLALQIGNNRRTAAYVAGSHAAGILSFAHTVGAEDFDDNGVSVAQNGLQLNGATVTDAFNNPANLGNLGLNDFLADFPGQKVRPFPTISFTDGDNRIWGDEGETAEAVFSLNPPPAMPTIVRYTFDHGTADADDYMAGSGEIVMPADATAGTIEIPIVDDNDIEPVREFFYVNLVDSAGYTPGSRTRLEVFIAEGVCDRTRQVRDGIRRNVSCTRISTSTINGMRRLAISARGIEELKEKDFLQLTGLDALFLRGNELTTLPEGVFADLGDLEILTLHGNDLTTLPPGTFSGLGSLELLTLYGNQLTTLPPGVFSGLSSLRSLRLNDNPGVPFRLTLGLELADEAPNVSLRRLADLLSASTPATVKLTLREGAPYPLMLALTATGVELTADQVTIPAGSTRSEMFTMTRNMDGNRVRIVLSESPTPPDDCPTEDDWDHEGPCFSGFEIVGAPIIDFVYTRVTPQATTIRFASAPQDPEGYVEGEVIQVDVVFDRGLAISPITEGSSSPTLVLRIGNSRRTATYVVGSNAAAGILSFVYAVTAGDIDDNGVSVVQGGLQLNGATVTDAVFNDPANLSVDDLLAEFPEQKVQAFPTISFEVTDVQPAEGETVNAVFNFNAAVAMPTTVRYILTPDTADAADYMDVAGSSELVVPEGTTSGAIQIFIVDDDIIERTRDRFDLDLVGSDGYVLGSPTEIEVRIREGVCDRTRSIRTIIRRAVNANHCSDVSSVPRNPFLSLTMGWDSVTTYKRDDFTDQNLNKLLLSSLTLSGHAQLTTLPAGLFGDRLEYLLLQNNALAALPENLFADLVNLRQLRLDGNDLTTLPEELFAGLVNLQRLRLNGNDLTTLPEGTFSGLSNLRSLQLHDNPGVPFRLTLGLEPADEAANVNLTRLASLLSANTPATVKLTLHEGAPYPLTLALTASGVELSTDQVTIPAGSTRSVAFTTTRNMDRVRIALSEPPSPPNDCQDSWKHQEQCFTGFEIVGAPIIDFVYDGMGPQVTTIRFTSAPQDPEGYVEGETIKVDVVFDRRLVISPITEGSSSPTLALQIGNNQRTATYVVGSNVVAGILSFVYPVTADDFDDNGVSVAPNGLELNGATLIEPVDGRPANVGVGGFLADFPGHKVSGNLLSVSFAETEIERAEGETVNAVFNFSTAVAMPTTVHYTLEPDSANADDYEAGSGEVVVPAGMSNGTIQIFIRDDDIVERPRDTFSLNLVDSEGYALGSPSRATINIREGICDRTPQVQDAILGRLSNVDDCADVTDGNLSGIRGNLPLNDKSITNLKEKDFSGLTSLEELSLQDNDLMGTLPANLFAELRALRALRFQNNQVSTWPASIFNGLSNLQTIDLGSNGITQLPNDIFADNGNLHNLLLGGNQLLELPEQVFFGLPQLRNLSVNGNRLTEVPAGAFPGYEFLNRLRLSDNQLESLPPGLFSDLESANWLTFHNNRLTALPPGAFSGPLSKLGALTLGGNLGSPFQLKLRLEFAGEEPAPTLTDDPMVLRATLREGAPYALAIELQASHGTLSTTEVAIEAGSTRSGTFTVTRLQGENSVAVSFADVSPPTPPNRCPGWQQHDRQCFSGLEVVSDAEFVLDDQPLSLSAVSGVAITSAPLAGDTYAAGDPNEEIVVELQFSGEIDVIQANDGSWPSLALEVGDETRFAVYDEAASSADKLVFRYKPQDDVDDDGISVPVGALRLNGAFILDAGVPLPLSSLSLVGHVIQNAPNHKVDVRNPRLSFDPAAVVLRAGGSPEVVALTLERDDLLQPGETVVVTLTPSQGLEVRSESGESLTMVTLGRGAEATTRIRVSANRGADYATPDAESLSATTSALFGGSRVAETTLRVMVEQREIRVLFEPGRILMVRGGAAAEMTSSAVTMRTEPELQSGEALVVSLSADGVRLVSPTGPVTLTPANNTVTVTLAATRPLSALGAVSATLDENASLFGNARVTTETLAVEVVRGVNLSLSGLAGQDSVRFVAGETTEVRVTTDPVLEGDERVTVTLSVHPPLSLESAGSALIDGNVLVLNAMNPDATVAVTTGRPNLDEANGVFASGAGENVSVAATSLRVITDVAAEVTLVLSPSPVVEVQQGGKAPLRVTTDPLLGRDQHTWVTLMIEPADVGFSFVTDISYFFRGASSSTMTVLLRQVQPSLKIDVVSASDAVIGNTAQVTSTMFDNTKVTVNVVSRSRVTLETTTPQVAIRFDPAPLALRLNTDKRVTLGFDDDFMLRGSQTAEFEVSVEGAGLSLQGNVQMIRVSFAAGESSTSISVMASDDAAPVGRLVVRPISDVELAGGMETASLPIEALQVVNLDFEPNLVLIPRSRSTQFKVVIDPPLVGDRQTTVTLAISAQGFAQGFAFDGGRMQHEITFDARKSRETVTVATTAAEGSMVPVSVVATRTSSGVDLAQPPSLSLQATLGTTLRIRVFLEGALE